MRDNRKKTFKKMVDDANNVVDDEMIFTSDNDFFKDMNKRQIKNGLILVWILFMKI